MLAIIVPLMWMAMVMSYAIGGVLVCSTYFVWKDGSSDDDMTYAVFMAGLFLTFGNWVNWHTLL